MKILIFILAMISVECFGSCLVKMDRVGGKIYLSKWSHAEGIQDSVHSSVFNISGAEELSILGRHTGVKIIFNEGAFTSMKWNDETRTIRWDDLTEREKKMIKFIRKKFRVDEH